MFAAVPPPPLLITSDLCSPTSSVHVPISTTKILLTRKGMKPQAVSQRLQNLSSFTFHMHLKTFNGQRFIVPLKVTCLSLLIHKCASN